MAVDSSRGYRAYGFASVSRPLATNPRENSGHVRSDQIRTAYTIEDYRLWQGDWELWDGIAIAMTPSPFGRHQAILVALVSELRAALREGGCEATALVELDWIVSNETVVRPDVIVVCGAAPEKHLEQARADRRDSFALDATERPDLQTRSLRKSGSWQLLIVDPDAKTIEQLSLRQDGNYELGIARGRSAGRGRAFEQLWSAGDPSSAAMASASNVPAAIWL